MEEITFTKIQRVIFDCFSKEKDLTKQFYFTGGTALSAVYLHHRESEDLDFFSVNDFSNEKVIIFIEKITSVIKLKFNVTIRERVRIFEFKKNNKLIIKVDFGYYPYKRLKSGKKLQGVVVDSMADIATNKLLTILQRSSPKDFVDLYFLLKKYTIWDLLHFVKVKFNMDVDLIWLASAFKKTEQFKNLPKMLVPLKLNHLKDFYRQEAKKIAKRVTEE